MFAGDALPGIRVDTVPAPVAEALPRMDMAVFAGFAERGPCHVAVALSSVAAYGAVFGGDCPLAWDDQGGRQLTGNLAATVRAFFSNGGTRCWAVRLAETDELAALRAAESGAADPGSRPARAGRFPLTGLLRRLPNAGNDATFVSPAILRAGSLGSWSDAMRLAARVSRRPVAIKGQAKVTFGFRFADPEVLGLGDLIELTSGEGLVKRYAKVVRIGGGQAWAMWIASFVRIAGHTPLKDGKAYVPGSPAGFAAEFQEGKVCSVRLTGPGGPAALVRGAWVNFRQPGESIWLRADRVARDRTEGPAWQQVGSLLPAGPVHAERVTFDIVEHGPGGDRVHTALAPAPEAANSVHRMIDADAFHSDPERRTAAIRPGFAIARGELEAIAAGLAGGDFEGIAARFGTKYFTASDRVALRSAWLPVGLDSSFPEPQGPLADPADPLVRDGLSRFDERLFLDPRLSDLRGAAMIQRTALREAGEQKLFGIHAALDIAGDIFPEPSLLAVPDASQPGWEIGASLDPPLPPRPGAPALANWRDHSGGCEGGTDTAPSAPDWSRFLDCSTRMLPAPVLSAPAQPVFDGEFTLSWNEQPEGAVAVLEESADPEFAAAAELLRSADVISYRVSGRGEGVYYYRLRIELDGNVSAYAAAAVTLRKARFAALAAEPARLVRIHAAMLRLAAAEDGFFALLSLPRAFRAADAAAYAQALATLAPGAGSAGKLGADEARLLSFGALYHPWLVARTGEGLVSSPPDGAAAGVMAARAQQRGAWIAPANTPLRDVVGLDPAIPAADLLPLDRARVNAVRHLPGGFLVHDADTLSPDREWRPINVRRLMMLLRRTLMRRGLEHVFEPNGAVLRRAVERSLTSTLDDLQLRGAFAGASSAQSFRVSVRAGAADVEAGRLVVEISVAPSQPIRFLTMRLIQQGARLTILEEV
ncbi:MAG TPA: phage tail sheath C-terminal domain-containing protein [Allosphingosinicella sp.]|jgi:hypothetical protein